MVDIKNSKDPVNILPNLHLNQEETRLVSLTFGITLYTDVLFSKNPEAILGCYDKFLSLCPENQLRFYASLNMRKHKPITKRVLGMLATWLKSDVPPIDYISLELKDGDKYQDAPSYKFKVFGGEKESSAFKGRRSNLISIAFPYEWALDRTQEMLNFVQDLCSIFPFQSGHAGFSFECSRYEAEISQTYAWQKSMKHWGIDISRIPEDARAVGQDAVKGVGWITILNDSFIEKLGGMEKITETLTAEVESITVPGGIILKAGSVPAAGDTNRGNFLPKYKKVYDVIRPMVEIAADRSLSFTLAKDYVEKTEAWFKRFANEP